MADAIERVARLLSEQQAALAARDLAALLASNEQLAQALAQCVDRAPGHVDAGLLRRTRALLRTQDELLARVRSANDLALAAIFDMPATYRYAGAGPVSASRKHVVA